LNQTFAFKVYSWYIDIHVYVIVCILVGLED